MKKKKRSGKIVLTRSGKIGRIFNDEKPISGKVRVYLLQDYEPTGEKLLSDPKQLIIKGYFD